MTGEAATPSSASLLRQAIQARGPLPFTDFMAMALYHPQTGYYARGIGQTGRGGDFFTSVSVGPLFGNLLARRFDQWWREAGRPPRWRVMELGAHDGTLANDILDGLAKLDSAAFEALEYVISEPLPNLRQAQQEMLGKFGRQIRQVAHPSEIQSASLPGIVFGNELLDALPFHVIEWCNGGWDECRVAIAGDEEERFVWQLFPIARGSELEEATAALGTAFPVGYRTELRTGFAPFLKPLVNTLTHGLLIWPDYGFARPEYYHPDRKEGTLRTFSRHRAAANPLETPGETDITAHVDFTAVAEAAAALGCHVNRFQSQGAWLTEVAREWLLQQEGNPAGAAMRQFQTLIHPAHLGRSFQVLELAWNPPAAPAPPAADLRRLALRP